MNNATEFFPRALSYVSRVNEAGARGKRFEVSSSGPDYRLALCLERAGLLRFGGCTVKNHVAYYELAPR